MSKPPLASIELESAMEAKELPESDRDEVRRFADVLPRLGKPKQLTPEEKDWLLGKDEATP